MWMRAAVLLFPPLRVIWPCPTVPTTTLVSLVSPLYRLVSQPWTVCRSECLYVKKFCPYMDIDCTELRDDPSICFRVKDAVCLTVIGLSLEH